jgi:nucleotide-binding universal stress UspA family protein
LLATDGQEPKAVVLTVRDEIQPAVFPPVVADGTPLVKTLVEDAERVAEEGVRLAKQQGFDATAVVVEGAPTWDPIVRAAEECGAEVIVLGSHGRSGLAYVALGSVATAVAHHAPCAVLIAHERDDRLPRVG